MNIFMARTAVGLGLALTLFSAGSPGFAASGEQQKAAKIGAQMQQSGIISKSDYIRIRKLQHQTAKTHTMSDTDLNWTLALLKKSKSAIPRARAMTALEDIRPMSAAQKAKIAPAIRPYLNSTDNLDQLGARSVQKSLNFHG